MGKKSRQECEDGLVVNDNFIAVIDGSTSKTSVRINPEMSNGRYCMELISRYINSMPAGIVMDDFCTNVTSVIRQEYLSHKFSLDYLKDHPVERLTASAAIFSRHSMQVWLVGDCQCIVDGNYYDNPKPQEQRLACKRSEYLKKALDNGLTVESARTTDPGRNYILEELKECCKQQNIDYPVIDGFDIPTTKVKVIDIRDARSDIILASDGYPFLKSTLEDSEAALARQLTDDPLCINTFKATKALMNGNTSFDDRCYIRFTL